VERVRQVCDPPQPRPVPMNQVPTNHQSTSHILLNNQSERFPKSQSYPIPVTVGSVTRQPPISDNNTHVIKADFVIGEDYPQKRETIPSQPVQMKGANSVLKEDIRGQIKDRLSPPKPLPGNACK